MNSYRTSYRCFSFAVELDIKTADPKKGYLLEFMAFMRPARENLKLVNRGKIRQSCPIALNRFPEGRSATANKSQWL
jgi:hypothetical protein